MLGILGISRPDFEYWRPDLNRGNAHFDAYLLSESSLFVYARKLILKTCGTTTLLLVLPKVLTLASQIGYALDNVHYSHFRYAFPQLQPLLRLV